MYYFSNVATHVALCFITRILQKKKKMYSSKVKVYAVMKAEQYWGAGRGGCTA